MLHTLWSMKGGSGVTVVSAALGALLARRCGRAVVVDLCGDQPAALGLSEPSGPGVRDWLASPDGDDRLAVLPCGVGDDWAAGRSAELVAALQALRCPVVVDAGCDREHVESAAAGLVGELRAAGTSLLVTRACYLGLRRAFHLDAPADGAVFVRDVGRALDRGDVQAVLRVPVMATVDWDPAVARAVDAGTLVRRPQRALERSLGALVPLSERAA
jgi:hypothetical protein